MNKCTLCSKGQRSGVTVNKGATMIELESQIPACLANHCTTSFSCVHVVLIESVCCLYDLITDFLTGNLWDTHKPERERDL